MHIAKDVSPLASLRVAAEFDCSSSPLNIATNLLQLTQSELQIQE